MCVCVRACKCMCMCVCVYVCVCMMYASTELRTCSFSPSRPFFTLYLLAINIHHSDLITSSLSVFLPFFLSFFPSFILFFILSFFPLIFHSFILFFFLSNFLSSFFSLHFFHQAIWAFLPLLLHFITTTTITIMTMTTIHHMVTWNQVQVHPF